MKIKKWKELEEGRIFKYNNKKYRKDLDTGYMYCFINSFNLTENNKCWFDPYKEVEVFDCDDCYDT